VSVDWVKIATESKLRRPGKSCFFRG